MAIIYSNKRNNPMDRIYLMTVFVAVAEAESFAKASRHLGMSPQIGRAHV